ncbi:hypothetical protein BGZ76_011093 [Entomortierella beljakovae]|nr:hypothetical protein BGZ76_011093 [Entomortierella beljakovae]
MNLGEIEQSNLGLQHINLNNLRIALLPGPKNRKSLVWESLGHAFLKFYLATHFFSKNQYDSEGRLTKRIQSESNNKRISELILSSCIREYIGAGHSSSCSVAKRIVAAAVLSGGVTSALKTVEWLGMVKERSVTTLGGLYTQYQHHRPARTIFSFSMSNISQSQSANILHRAQLAQNILGYKFVDLEIFKNSTDNSTNEFQRLELLGDAVLEYLVADHYRSVGSLQEFNTKKTLVLTNNVLGSLFVSLGLEFTVQVAATDLNTAIEDARYKIAMNSRLDSIRVKKTLGDAMEAIVGGIFVDSGFDLNTVKEVLNRTLFPFANRSYVIKVIAGMSEDFPINLVEIRDSREGTSINNPISLVEVEDEDEEELPRVAIEKRKASPVEGEAEISRRKRFRYFRF